MMTATLSHRKRVGGMWDEIGRLQFDFLVAQGLKPRHKLLDIGCGCLRGGVHFVRYLESGHYFGVDKDRGLLVAGRNELIAAGLGHKDVDLLYNDHFEFGQFEARFDFALAQSVFTHLTPDDILLCLRNLEPVLAQAGVLFATFFEGPRRLRGGSYFYPFSVFSELADEVGLRASYIGGWQHPRGQKMMRIERR